MRVFTISSGGQGITETDALPTELPDQAPAQGFIWIACARREFEVLQAQIQASLQSLCGTQLVDLHVSDLLNNQLPSHYDYT
ncbi:MAG: magnesium transporter CorA, partial [Polaromonas sp.]